MATATMACMASTVCGLEHPETATATLEPPVCEGYMARWATADYAYNNNEGCDY